MTQEVKEARRETTEAQSVSSRDSHFTKAHCRSRYRFTRELRKGNG